MQKIAILGTGITGTAVKEKVEELGDFIIVEPEEADLIVASPGIPPAQYPAVKAEIISEIEFAYRLMQSGKYGLPPKIVAISGTNGKTTTTTLTGIILNCPTAGNIGKPLISFVGDDNKYIACEVSSYQLETSPTFKPYIAVLLNLTEDHLARHGTMQEYCNTKASMVIHQNEKDFFVYNRNDEWLKQIAKNAPGTLVPFTSETTLGQNYEAVRKVAEICTIPLDSVEKVFSGFKGVEHRLEEVAVFQGIKIINDSKATNPDSTIAALESVSEPVILIAGGKDKMCALDQMINIARQRVKKYVLCGEASDRFEKEFISAGIKKEIIYRTDNMLDAVETAFNQSSNGDTILLSPACASFDMYNNFEERGADFKKIVEQYIKNAKVPA
ncbi:MAG: UDP-N-acetylmuramoyl-L-alanine--D-glutamate ligase [Candidatus Margulisiibacteriota bacterium]